METEWKNEETKAARASIYKDNNGASACWRARLGKSFTGGAPVKKSFRSYRDASKWLRDQEKARAEHGRGAFLMSDAQVAEGQDAFARLAAATKLPLWAISRKVRARATSIRLPQDFCAQAR